MTTIVSKSPIDILTVRFRDANGYTWVWDLDEGWLDIEYEDGQDIIEGSGYPAETWTEVMKVMIEGGFV